MRDDYVPSTRTTSYGVQIPKDERWPTQYAAPVKEPQRNLEVVVVGAGFGGVAAAVELQSHGFRDITILEASPEIGGTWFHNTYPGAACDVPSHLYSFSFAQRRDWSRLCSPQDEILRYIREVAHDHGVDGLVVPDSPVSECSYDETACRWTVTTGDGRLFEADVLVVATGQLHQPAFPRVPGVEDFEGHSFHSARWDHGYPLAGKRVAVLGTGASAVQFVPEIAAEVERLYVFQRSPNWFLPRKNRAYPAPFRWIVRHVPGVQAFRRRFIFEYAESLTAAIRHPRTFGRLVKLRSAGFMRMQVRDPQLRAKIWPDYTFGCKRILFSSDFLPALTRPNVELVTDPVAGIAPTGLVTPDGKLREADCIIYATGFKTNDFMFPMEIRGAGGRVLREEWAGGAHAHLGMTVPGFPSMFLMYGPNTNTSGGSIIAYLEAQAAYIRQALALLRDRRAGAIEVRPEVEAASDREVQARFAGTAWTGCDSWYRDASGRIVANWPGYMREYFQRTRELDPAEFSLLGLPEREPAPAG
jgi:cation diffusion facilitator CzcD-associated flavoprotein CzcO